MTLPAFLIMTIVFLYHYVLNYHVSTNNKKCLFLILILASEISEYSEEASGEGAVSEVDTSYSADVSQASDIDDVSQASDIDDVSKASDVSELCTDKTLQDHEQEYENEDPRDSKYFNIIKDVSFADMSKISVSNSDIPNFTIYLNVSV